MLLAISTFITVTIEVAKKHGTIPSKDGFFGHKFCETIYENRIKNKLSVFPILAYFSKTNISAWLILAPRVFTKKLSVKHFLSKKLAQTSPFGSLIKIYKFLINYLNFVIPKRLGGGGKNRTCWGSCERRLDIRTSKSCRSNPISSETTAFISLLLRP